MRTLLIAIALLTAGVYAGIVAWGVHASHMPPRPDQPIGAIAGVNGDNIRRGQNLFNNTPQFAPQYTGDALSCESCHAEGGTQPYAIPMTGVARRFPQYSARAGHSISLEDRIRECFVRSENGSPPDDRSETMAALVAYLRWMSPATSRRADVAGTGLVTLPVLKPNPVHGAELYAVQCAGCHGADGGGNRIGPPLWGAGSFNDGAGMNRIGRFAAFIQHNMPQNRMGMLTPQEAYDVAGFVLTHARPAMNPAYERF